MTAPSILSYLYQTASGTVGSDGVALVGPLAPDVGQFWCPTLVNVGIRTQALPLQLFASNVITSNARCELHSGSIAVLAPNQLDPSTVKDVTGQGANDSSSILSGTVISYGEGILCRFTNGNPGDIVYMELHGISSSVPPTLGIIPNIPGARFFGNNSASDLIVPAFSTPLINAGNTFISNNGSAFDMRNFVSYNLRINSSVTTGPTSYDPINIGINWYDTALNAAQSANNVLYQESYGIHAEQVGTFASPFGRFMIHDSVHGPFMTYTVTNNGPDQVQINHQLAGNSIRPVGQHYVTNTPNNAFPGNALGPGGNLPNFATGLGAGAIADFIWPIMPGQLSMTVVTVGQPFLVQLFDTRGQVIWQQSVIAGATNTFFLATPRVSIRVQLTNQGGAAGNIFVFGMWQSDMY